MKINSEKKRLNCEGRIKVLTSQHEDMFFLVKFQGSKGGTIEPQLTCFSFPIKVISKPEQPKKRKVPALEEEASRAPKKRKTKAEKLMDSLQRIQEKQKRQDELLRSLEQRISGGFVTPVFPSQSFNNSVLMSDNTHQVHVRPMAQESQKKGSKIQQTF